MAERAADEVRRRTLHDQRIQLYGDALNKMLHIERVDGEDADVLIRRVAVLASSPFLSAFFGWYGDLLVIADGSLTEAEKTQAQTRIEKHQATALEVARLEAQGRFKEAAEAARSNHALDGTHANVRRYSRSFGDPSDPLHIGWALKDWLARPSENELAE